VDYQFLNPEYFAPLPDIGMALERIGLQRDEDLSPSVEHLSKIMLAYMMTVPFENLDIYDYRRQIDFCLPHLFEKIVVNRRGGYCYELNSFFMGILEALGYECYALGGRLLFGSPVMVMAHAHRTTIVTVGGAQYICDVGFGGAGNAEGPVLMDTEAVQEIRGRRYAIEHHDGDFLGDLTLYRYTEQPGAEPVKEPFITLYKRPHTVLEFIALNYHMSHNPASHFVTNRAVRLLTETGSIAIDNKIYRRHVNGEVFEEEITSNKRLYGILTGDFKMIVPKMSFSADFPRVWF
jgi:N-hydroxyarylamine O-acetyltransferase